MDTLITMKLLVIKVAKRLNNGMENYDAVQF